VLVCLDRPGEGGPQVVVILLEAFEPFNLVRTAGGVERVIGQSDEELSVSSAPRVTLTGVGEFPESELPQRLEEAETSQIGSALDHRLVHERCEVVEDIELVDTAARHDRFRRVERESPAEHG